MKRYSKFILVACAFIGVSALLYFVHYTIFHDMHHIFIYMVGDLAFLPVEVFLVVIVIERVLARREKQAIMEKLNMVIGAFFSEVGTHLLRNILTSFGKSNEIASELNIKSNWAHADFKAAMAYVDSIEDKPDSKKLNLDELKTFLVQKRSFLLGLLENPNLLEHESFTDLLWATFHLAEELEARQSLEDLPDSDLQHIIGDVQRVYRCLTVEWLSYTEHLKLHYPYLFSLIVRMNPFQEHSSPIVV